MDPTVTITGDGGTEATATATVGVVDTDQLFTVQRLDGTGLYYYNARYYDATIGRFISPDPIIQTCPQPQGLIINALVVSYLQSNLIRNIRQLNDIGLSNTPNVNPQELNRYTYSINNPLRYVDPDGNQTEVALLLMMAAIPGWGWIALAMCVVVIVLGPTVYNAVDDNMPKDKSKEKDKNKNNSGDSSKYNPKQGKGQAPKQGEPNSTYEQVDNKGNVRSRTTYNGNGQQSSGCDYDHTHYDKATRQQLGHHEHILEYNEKGQFIR